MTSARRLRMAAFASLLLVVLAGLAVGVWSRAELSGWAEPEERPGETIGPPSMDCPAEMALVPDGYARMAVDRIGGFLCNLRPYSTARLHVQAFCLDRWEVTIGEFTRCTEAGVCHTPTSTERPLYDYVDYVDPTQADIDPGCNAVLPDHEAYPANCVDAQQASEYCGWLGKRLPSVDEAFRVHREYPSARTRYGNSSELPTWPVGHLNARTSEGDRDVFGALVDEFTATPCEFPFRMSAPLTQSYHELDKGHAEQVRPHSVRVWMGFRCAKLPTSPAQEQAERFGEECPTGMVRAPGGDFLLSGPIRSNDKRPEGRETLRVSVEAFCLDARRVSLKEMARCVASGACPDTGGADLETPCPTLTEEAADPGADCVNWYQASAYCKWVGKRQPSENELAYAKESALGGPWSPTSFEWTGSRSSETLASERNSSSYALGPGDHRPAAPPWYRKKGIGFRCAR